MFSQSLAEKDRRRSAALEARKLGRGGLSYSARILSCDRHTITQGMPERTDPEALQQTRIRREGGGRQPRHERLPDLAPAFLQVLEDPTAGSPMNAAVKWTNLTPQEIADRLAADHGLAVRITVGKRLVRQHNCGRRKAPKRTRTGACAHRDAPFVQIARCKEDSRACGKPVVSMDTKKKQ
jgi:hypothetical protein